MNREIKIITLGDIFKNIETEEKAFEFLNYIQNLQQENKRLKNMLEQADNKNLELIEIINEIYDVIEDKNITGIETRLKIQEILESKGE